MQGLNLVRANTEDSSVLLSDDPCEIPSHKIWFNFQKKAIKLENKVSFNALFLEVIFISMRGFFFMSLIFYVIIETVNISKDYK